MRRQVLDASALVAFAYREKGYVTVAQAMSRASATDEPLLISAVNWGEALYILARDMSKEQLDESLRIMTSGLPVDVVPVDREFAEAAAKYKMRRKLSYADSFAAALTSFSKGELLTSDRDFESVSREIKITWL